MALYTVVKGDTLWAIARRYGVTWRELYEHGNNATFREKRPDPDRIYPGDVLWVPQSPYADECSLDDTDTAAIARRSKNTLTVQDLYYIRLAVFDANEDPVPGRAYIIQDMDGEELFAGTTDNQGFINHDGIALDDYNLIIDGFLRTIPALAYCDARCDVFLPARRFLRLALCHNDGTPAADLAYTIEDPAGHDLFTGVTDARGFIDQGPVALAHYKLVIGGHHSQIPTMSHEEERLNVRVPLLTQSARLRPGTPIAPVNGEQTDVHNQEEEAHETP